jgi:membrane-bound lytic murein transglycosylase B
MRHAVTRTGVLASIAAGLTSLVLAGTLLPLADANSTHHDAARHSATPAPFSDVPPPLPMLPSAAAQPTSAAATPPARSAPADPAAISGLAANGVPRVALNAYRVAAARMDNVDPGCRIGWWLLAAIGRVESDHGRFGGAVLHADGISTPRMIGPALDGKHWDYIPAPANGLQLDGDAKYAHALGPMQFIPSTWAIYGADETGDGKADVFNINDAALGTARYLCAAGGDLSTQAGRVRAVLAYNHSAQYLAEVLALADAYRLGVRVTGIPIIGVTKGGLPSVVDTGYVPPANPAAPTAVSRTGTKKKTPPPTGTTTSPAPSGTPASTTTRVSSPAPGTSSVSQPATGSSTPAPGTSSSCGLLPHLVGRC